VVLNGWWCEQFVTQKMEPQFLTTSMKSLNTVRT